MPIEVYPDPVGARVARQHLPQRGEQPHLDAEPVTRSKASEGPSSAWTAR
jgi:hypothetical protein